MHAVPGRPTDTLIPARIAAGLTPQLFAQTSQEQFWEFFGANIRKTNTRMAYVTTASPDGPCTGNRYVAPTGRGSASWQ